MRALPRYLLMAGTLLGLASCQPRLTSAERDLIHVWLLCDDCDGGERQRVAALGGRAVSTLAMALQDGPSATGRTNIEAQHRELYQRLGPVPFTEAEYVAEFVGNYILAFRTRAALSLGDIGTPDAMAALAAAAAADQAGTDSLPPSLRSEVRKAIGAALPPFGGTVSDSVVPAFDTVVVFRGGAVWDGDETVSLRGAPFPDDLLLVRTADSLAFLAAAPAGTYILSIENEEGGAKRAPLRITSRRYVGHDVASAPEVGGAFPRTILLSLAPASIGDTTDLFRLSLPDLPGTVTVQADWHGPGNVDLEWGRCPGSPVVDPGTGATAGRPESLVLPLPIAGGGCRLILVMLRSAPQSVELVRLTITFP